MKMESFRITQVSDLSDQQVFCVCVYRKKLCSYLCNCCFFATPSCRCFRDGLTKVFLPMFYHSLPRKHVTRIGLFSLDTLTNVFASVFFIVQFRVCDHNMPCALEINCNNGPYEGDVKSCPSTTKNMISTPL